MPAEHRPQPHFDEQAALSELERLQHAIEESRRQRKDAVARFDAFVRSFQHPVPAPGGGEGLPPAAAVRVSRAPTHLPPPEGQSGIPPVPAAAAPPSVVSAKPGAGAFPAVKPADTPSAVMNTFPAERPPVPEALVATDASPPSSVRNAAARRGRLVPVAAAAVLVIGAIVLLMMRPWRAPVEPPASQPAAPAAVTPTPAAPDPSPAATAPAAAGQGTASASAASESGIQGELVTLRPAWVRVTLDGERALERELPADTRIPLRAERTIAVRVGDAGAVRLTIDGRDQGPLGDAGEVVTRTFTARPRAPR